MTTLDLGLLERTRDAVNRDASFRALGSCDARVGLRADARAFLVTFEAFECAAVAPIEVDDLRDTDFYLELAAPAGDAYLNGRRSRSAPTLLSLDLDTPGGIVRSAGDPRKALEFERYHATLQAFIDAGATASDST